MLAVAGVLTLGFLAVAVILFDGLTKNWRYPGWRVTWTVGPRSVIDGVASAGSFLDGGGSRPLQRAALQAVQDGGPAQGDPGALAAHLVVRGQARLAPQGRSRRLRRPVLAAARNAGRLRRGAGRRRRCTAGC